MPLAVTGELNKKQYTADGIQTTFPFPYKFFKNTDLEVYIGSSLKTLTTDYSVVGIGSSFENGANVVFGAAPGAGSFITIARLLPVDQPTDYKDYATFPNEQFNADLDRRAMIEQQLLENINRQLAVHITEAEDLNLELPPSDSWPNQFLGFDAEKKLMVGQPVGAPTSLFMQTLLDDPDSATARATLNAAQAKESYTPVSGYVPAANDVVEMYYDGTIRKAKRFNSAVLAAASNVTRTRIARLDATHSVVAYTVGLVLSAAIVTIDPITLLPSYGIPLMVFTFTTTAASFDISPADATHVLVGYSLTGASYTQLSVVTLTANIEAGTLVLNTPVNGSAAAQAVSFYPIPGGTRTFMAWVGSGTTLLGAVVSVAGTVPTINASATDTVTNITIPSMGQLGLCVFQDGSAAVVAYTATDTNHDIHMAAFNLSGTTTTFANDLDTALLSQPGYRQFVDDAPSSSMTVLDRLQASATGGVVLAQPTAKGAGNLTTIGTATLNLGSSPGLAGYFLRAVDKPSGIFMVVQMRDGQDTFPVYRFFFMRRKGRGFIPSFDFGDEYCFSLGANISAGFYGGADTLSSGTTVVSVTSLAGAGYAWVIAMRCRNTVLGIAVDNQGTVQRSGTYVGSGFTQGAKYFADDNGNPSTTRSEVELGYAKSATELELAIKTGV